MLINQGSERTEPRNHYTTAPLVITRVTQMTSPWRLIPTSTIKNTSKNRRCNQTNLVTRWGLTNRWTVTLFDEIESKQNPNLIWWWLLNKKELGACKSPRCNPNGFQHGTRANGPTDGDTAPWQILDAQLFRRFPSTQKKYWGGTSAIGSSMKFSFQAYIERPNPTSYVARASILVKSGSGIWGGFEVELDLESSLVWTS
jgi:hypothetical protein